MSSSEAGGEQRKRFHTFGITDADVKELENNSEFFENNLPRLLEIWNADFADWPEIHAALTKPEVHRIRVRHWIGVATGRFGLAFTESARKLAVTFYENGVPGYAVAICHHTVLKRITAELGLEDNSRQIFRNAEVKRKANLRSALNKAAWMDLELLLETYTEAEQKFRSDMMNTLALKFEQEVQASFDGARTKSKQMHANAMRIADVVSVTGQKSLQIASTAQQASIDVQTVATASEELNASINEISRQMGSSSFIAREAVERAEVSNRTVFSLVDTAHRIGEVVNLINNIASQTNLLALNATIEAARAGEAGKGFAVVAGEVKGLANQTAKATEEIAAQINSMQNAARNSAETIKEVGATINQISEIVVSVTAAVEEQAAATLEITRSIQEVATGMQSVTRIVQEVSGIAEESTAASTEVLDASNQMELQSSAIDTQVKQFLTSIRNYSGGLW
ncbi:MAG: methyl-accepting chemotaxis protein [Alphaproteobacteria bacterium]